MTWLVIGIAGAAAILFFSPFILSSRVSRLEEAERDRNRFL